MNPILKLFYWIYSFSNIHLLLLIIITPAIWKIFCEFVLKKCKLSLKIWRILCTLLLLFCVFNIFYVTIGMRNSCERIVYLTPFYSIIGMSSGAVQSSLLNVVLFEPMGMLVPIVFDKESHGYDGVWKEIVLCILFSAVIEITQYVFRLGTVEIDDVIFNTLGYAIGRGGILGLTIVVRVFEKDDKKKGKFTSI